MTMADVAAIGVSILLMASTIIASAVVVLKVRPAPIGQALIIAAVSNGLGKILVSFFHWPAPISYSIPTVMFLALSFYFFRPTTAKLVVYWLVGFALYLIVHVAIALLFGWIFMFPFWDPRALAAQVASAAGVT